LSGEAKVARNHFTEMKIQYPDNTELELNYAESLMWSKAYEEAKKSYQVLYNNDPSSFPAVLGYANALSNLLDYNNAAEYIDKALSIQPGNANALQSRKYILLGLANQLKINSKYVEADSVFIELTNDYKNDIDVLLSFVYLKLDENKLKDAEKLLLSQLDAHPSDYRLLSTLSSIKLRQLKFSKASHFLDGAVVISNVQNEVLPFDLLVLELNLNLSQQKYKKAEALLERIDATYGSAKSREMWVSFLLNLKEYSKLESFAKKESSKDFYFTTMAKIALQKGTFRKARTFLDSVSNGPENKSIHYYLGKEIEKQFYHSVRTQYEIMEDNGGTYAESFNVQAITNKRNKGQLYLGYHHRKVMSEQAEMASASRAELGLIYQMSSKLNSQINIAYNRLNKATGDNSNNLQYYTNLKYNFSNRHFLGLVFTQNTFDYNVDLIDRSITDNRLSAQYYNMFFKNMGAYVEANNSFLSDGNRSNFLFISVFNNFKTLPLLQAGINYTYLTYSEKSSYYFSPKSYDVKEVFLKYDNRYHPNQKIIASATVGVGQQNINDEERQYTQRLNISLGYKFGNENTVETYYNYNNSASAVLSGYKVQRIGIKASFRL
jgi:tetratricopeptide (TPR) repeat protein